MYNVYIYTYLGVHLHSIDTFMSICIDMHTDIHIYMCMCMNKISLKEYIKKLFLKVCFRVPGWLS